MPEYGDLKFIILCWIFFLSFFGFLPKALNVIIVCVEDGVGPFLKCFLKKVSFLWMSPQEFPLGSFPLIFWLPLILGYFEFLFVVIRR